MLFRSHRPAAPLRGFVEDFWLYDGYAGAHLKERILPSATFELVINLRDDELRIYDAAQPDRCRRFPGTLVSGPYRGPFVTDMAQEASIMGVHFRPGGALPFLGLPAGDFADAHVALESLWGLRARELRERLVAAASPADRFRLLEEFLAARLVRRRPLHGAVAVALAALGRPAARTRIRDIARHVGLSQRRLIEVFKDEVGLSPKLFGRLQRFQRALTLARATAAPDWAELALDCGYFDQSHLIRDFLAFSGSSPADFFRRQDRLRQEGAHIKRNHLPLADAVQIFPRPARPAAG